MYGLYMWICNDYLVWGVVVHQDRCVMSPDKLVIGLGDLYREFEFVWERVWRYVRNYEL